MNDQSPQVETPSEGAVATSQTTNANPSPDASSSEPFLTVKRRGQETALSREQAVQFAQKGLDYEAKMSEVAAQRADIQDLLQLREAAKQDPQLREALRTAFENPARVLQALRSGNGATHLGESDEAPAEGVEAMLERKLQPIQRELQSARQEKLTTTREQAIERAINGHEFLSESKAGKAFVKSVAAAELLRDPSVPIEEAVGTATMLYLEAQKERQQKLLDKSLSQAPLKTQPPNVGTPPGQTAQPRGKFDPNTLRRGGVRERVMQEVRQPGFMEKFFGQR